MPGRVLHEHVLARVQSCAARLSGLELGVLDSSGRLGPVFKEALASLEAKLKGVRPRAAALEEVGRMRAALLWRELEPAVEALEGGLNDLERILRSAMPQAALRPEELEAAYDDLSRLERRFLVRLRHTAGEPAAEGHYRCCGCGAFNRPGPGFVLVRCARCGGNCHHHVPSS